MKSEVEDLSTRLEARDKERKEQVCVCVCTWPKFNELWVTLFFAYHTKGKAVFCCDDVVADAVGDVWRSSPLVKVTLASTGFHFESGCRVQLAMADNAQFFIPLRPCRNSSETCWTASTWFSDGSLRKR